MASSLVCVGVATIPIFSDRYLSINDYLNHLARGAVLLNYHSNPAFAQFFAPNWQMLPNLALDVWILGLGQILPVDIAGKLFVAATLALMLGGIICLHRVTFEKWSLWPFLAIVLLYNRLLLIGLLNFLFGIGLWLFVLSLWIYLRPGRRIDPRLGFDRGRARGVLRAPICLGNSRGDDRRLRVGRIFIGRSTVAQEAA